MKAPPVEKPPVSRALSVSSGMLWVTFATVFGKGLSFVSQIALGHLLSVETFAVFALAAGGVALVGGFQNASVSKHLVQHQDRFEELFPQCSAFTFQFGLLGALLLLGVGFAFAQIYSMPVLFGVLALASLSMPLIAVNTTLVASLSIGYQFREINLNEALKSVVYYITLVAAAYLGSGAFTVALATLVGAVVAHLLLRRASGRRPVYLRFNLVEFKRIAFEMRWVLLSGFLFAFAMRSDYFVLGKALTTEDVGFYAFAFMLVTSLTIPISAGINQVFLPIFSSLQRAIPRLQDEFVRFSGAIVILGSVLCLGILGVGSVLVHLAWGGKWDAAAFVITVLVVVMPFRFLSTISSVGLEAIGKWRTRNFLLLFETGLLAGFAFVGAAWEDLSGAIIGVAIQRALSGLVNFVMMGKVLQVGMPKVLRTLIRLYIPFGISAALLFALSQDRHLGSASLSSLTVASAETFLAVVVFAAVAYLLNREFAATIYEFVLRKIKKRSL